MPRRCAAGLNSGDVQLGNRSQAERLQRRGLVRRYRILITEIHESDEVYLERLIALFRASKNIHEKDAILAYVERELKINRYASSTRCGNAGIDYNNDNLGLVNIHRGQNTNTKRQA